MLNLFLVTVLGTFSVYFASQPALAGLPNLWLLLFLTQLPVALVVVYSLFRRRELFPSFSLKPGDVMRGVSIAGILIIAIWSGRALLMPHGSVREAWLARLYIHLGDPALLERIWWMPLVILGLAVSDEVVWRGYLQPRVVKRFGVPRGLVILALAYGLQAVPTAFALSDSGAGKNPLLPLFAFVTGLAWSYITHLSGRVTPAIISHAVLAYFVVLEYRPGL
jgi:membrane protease YdiL (CAAX protease family)